MKKLCSLICAIAIMATSGLLADSKNDANPYLPDFSILGYLRYTATDEGKGFDDNKFSLGRAYLTAKKKMTDLLDFRMTLDCYDDDDGVEIRVKYLYANFNIGDLGPFTNTYVRYGLTHTPWLDFEEHINIYRMESTMFMERTHVFNSADYGASIGGYLGGEMDKDYKKRVNKKYAGKWGSYIIGVYNGGGYHDLEQNSNKTIQGRLTLRPLQWILPGLQLSYLGIQGKDNRPQKAEDGEESYKNWELNAGMLSYEHEYFTATVQYMQGIGDKVGKMHKYVGAEEKEYTGYSGFLEGKYMGWRAFTRYDVFDSKSVTIDDKKTRYDTYRFIGGFGYDFGKHNILLLSAENYITPGNHAEFTLALTMQIHL